MKRIILAIACMIGCGLQASAQGRPTASRLGDLQVGGGYTIANSDYVTNNIRGLAFYGDFDVRNRYGLEVDFHQLNDPNSIVYERTYEVGGRYLFHPRFLRHGTFYAKGLYGRGVFNFPPYCRSKYTGLPVACNDPNVDPNTTGPAANLAYNMLVMGGGVDIAVHPRINVRADYEYQHWMSFPPNGLSPQLITIGVAYHFPAGKPRKLAGH